MKPHKDNPVLDDKTFLQQFENQTLDPVHFSHLGHLRLAWLYLYHNDLDVALEKVCLGIKAYAESLGADTKFHLTMTDAFVRIMAKRIDAMEKKSWQDFLESNGDLLKNSRAVLLEYFSEGLLFSEEARTSLLQPDIRDF